MNCKSTCDQKKNFVNFYVWKKLFFPVSFYSQVSTFLIIKQNYLSFGLKGRIRQNKWLYEQKYIGQTGDLLQHNFLYFANR